MEVEFAYKMLLWFFVAFIALMICAVLIRAILGPRFTDRIVAVDAMCSLGTIAIVLLFYIFNDKGLLDIALVYAMVGFLAVVVLTKSYLLAYNDRISDKGQNPTLLHLPDEDSEEIFG